MVHIMYYIINQNQQVIATDSDMLALLSVKNIDELYTKIALGDIKFSSLGEQVTITTSKGETSYPVTTHTLTGILGNITLVQIEHSSHKEERVTKTLAPQEDLISIHDRVDLFKENANTDEKDIASDLFILDDESISFSDIEELHEEDEKISLLKSDDILFGEKEPVQIGDDELFDLVLPSAPEEHIEELFTFDSESKDINIEAKKMTSIVIDVERISREIGISIEDYNNFLNEYIDTALTLEKDIQSSDSEKNTNAIMTLSHLSTVLHLPMITDILTDIKNSTSENKNTHVKSLYDTLLKLTTTKINTETNTVLQPLPKIKPLVETSIEENFKSIETNTELNTTINEVNTNIEELQPLPKIKPLIKTSMNEGFGSIDLGDVKPIRFDFQLEEAADSLDLPINLIEEFIHDFIDQAHSETQKMLVAYEKGDLESIQKIGHLLKGISSNLHIGPLSDTLYKIQLCEESNQLESLIKEYWAHFLSFKTQIDLKTKS